MTCGYPKGTCEHTNARLAAARKLVEAALAPEFVKPKKAAPPQTPVTIWKIRAADGTFSKGGSYVGDRTFSKNGKTWQRASDLTSHLAQLDGRAIAEYNRRGCRIVSYEIVPTGDIKIEEWIVAADERREVRNKSKEAREKAERKAHIAREIAANEERIRKLKELDRKL
jgi:hypothetical protein